MYKIEFTPTFQKDISKLDKSIVKKIIEKIKFLAQNPNTIRFRVEYLPEDLEKLFKYRIGNWRIYFWIDDKKEQLTLYGVEHRKENYKRFKK